MENCAAIYSLIAITNVLGSLPEKKKKMNEGGVTLRISERLILRNFKVFRPTIF